MTVLFVGVRKSVTMHSWRLHVTKLCLLAYCFTRKQLILILSIGHISMKRKEFLRLTALLPFAMNIKELAAVSEHFPATDTMPALFLGHGSPMNAIEENEFVAGFRAIAKTIPRPKAILCVSAHWETKGTYVTAMEHPRTIHDFGGFPQALFDVHYPAPGSPALAEETKALITKTRILSDHEWGLDHGTWSVVKHLYPNADIPVIQMSLDYSHPPLYHYELAQQLQQLRNKGILIIGSGNMVHNLRLLDWRKLSVLNYGFDWAKEAQETITAAILSNNHDQLIHYSKLGKAFELAIPTPEHYLPLLYILALKKKNEIPQLYNNYYVAGSLTMTSVVIS